MFKIFSGIKNMRANASTQTKSVDKEPNMSVEKWYELQHKLRLQQMAQARATQE